MAKKRKNVNLTITSSKLIIILLQIYLIQSTKQRNSQAEASLFDFSSSATAQKRNSPVEELAPNLNNIIEEESKNLPNPLNPQDSFSSFSDKRLFVVELLKLLHEQYGAGNKQQEQVSQMSKKEDRQASSSILRQGNMMTQLLGAIGADGDVRRLIDWVQNSFNLASVGELTTQFVVSKLGSVNCAALLKPDPEETLIPRFLLFNEQFPDVPFELKINPTPAECLQQARFDPEKKTIVLIHGYLTGYTLVDGLTNIKNRILDLNKYASERFLQALSRHSSNSNLTLFSDLELGLTLRQQQYNVIIVDWFNGANPTPRSRYIRSAVNAQVVGQLIGRFLSALIVQCRTPAQNMQIIAHSLGCHVAGFMGKAMRSAGHRIGKITHLDPVGLCFGRMFSEPRFRLSPDDAIETQAVHVSLNLFDNPLDGAQANFLVNGGRDQAGCGGQSELKNSTSSSVALLFDNDAKFRPCSHIRAISLLEDDLSSQPNQCQIVGYRCATYERFLAGKCGRCDASNSQCRLMSLPPINPQVRRFTLPIPAQFQQPERNPAAASGVTSTPASQVTTTTTSGPTAVHQSKLNSLVDQVSNGSIAWIIDDKELNQKIGQTIAKMKPELVIAGENRNANQRGSANNEPQQNYHQNNENDIVGRGHTPSAQQTRPQKGVESPAISDDQEFSDEYPRMPDTSTVEMNNNNIKRIDRKLSNAQRDRLSQTLDKLRSETRHALSEGWSSLKSAGNLDSKYKVGTIIKAPFLHHLQPAASVNVQPQLESILNSMAQQTAHLEKMAAAAAHSVGPSATPLSLGPTTKYQQTEEHALEPPPPAPLGSQAIPAGSVNAPIYFVGTGAISPYCVNYYQLRILIAESRINRLLEQQQLLKSHHHHHHQQLLARSTAAAQGRANSLEAAAAQQLQRQAAMHSNELHLTVKLTDNRGHFFKGLTVSEDARALIRVPIESKAHRVISGSENMVELTMLLNTTAPEPVKVGEVIISYYFHKIVLADLVEVNYMSNISPQIRARHSSILCPLAINDQHQLVRYVECDRVGNARK